MGYRSQVFIGMTKEAYKKHETVLREHLKDCDEFSQTEEAYYFKYEYSKWYPSYGDVAAIEGVLDQLEDNEFGFCRVGEEDGDIEKRGEPWEFEMDVAYSFDTPSGEQVISDKERDLFFSSNAIKFIKEEDA